LPEADFLLYKNKSGGFAMQKNYDFRQTEKEMQKLWRDEAVYRFDPESPKEIYSIDTPPPTVSGSLHIGHIFSYAQAEMIARFKRMQGYNVFYPFGFDDNGLPTERLVEREGGIIAKDMPRSEFISKCLATTTKYEKEFKDLWQSLGFSVDWSLQYETINPKVRRISQRSFIRLFKEGKAYMKESPVLWCTECRTSIAQAELETSDKDTAFNYILFELVGEGTSGTAPGEGKNADGPSGKSKTGSAAEERAVAGEREGSGLIVATTRPELLYGCVCLFVNPADERYKQYIGKIVRVPLYDYESPVLADNKVSLDKGTGVVMCATFGDAADADWVESHKLPYRKVILPDGMIDGNVPFIGGLKVPAARRQIISLLNEKGLLIKSENISHTVAVHERCGKEIEIIPSKQWYINILSNKELYLKAADKINWYPSYMKNRYTIWVENLKWDWCISRQRYFGVPFPLWYCRDCDKVIIADEDILPVNPLETSPGKACPCGCCEFVPESAVFDTWATSSVTPQINAGWGEEDDASGRLLPMSMRTQAHEIIRTWAFYTIVKSLYHTGEIPWKDIMICGFVLAKKGEKISKSKNNSELSPTVLIENHSADVIRYWAANSKLGTDTFFTVEELGISRRFVTKLWNAAGFAISHLQDIDIEADVELMPVDRWIMARCRQTISGTAKLLEQYEIGAARHEMDEFFWKDLCDYYLEIVKERLYQPEIHGYAERRSAQKALYYCMLNLLKLYAIYVPHITEHIYQEFFKRHEGCISLHKLCWDQETPAEAGVVVDCVSCSPMHQGLVVDCINCSPMLPEILQFGEKLKDIIAGVRKYKTENTLSMKAEIPELIIDTGNKHRDWFERTLMDIKACCRAKEVRML
jgi:valyl-tRNA synthetase